MQKPTIHIVQKMAPGGIELLVRRLADECREPVYIFSLETPEIQKTASNNGETSLHQNLLDGNFYSFDKKGGLDPALIFRLRKKLKELAPNLVVTHHIGPLLYGTTAARLARVPIVAHIEHDAWHLDDSRQRFLTVMTCQLTKPHLMAVSRSVAKKVSEITGNKEIAVIPNGVDTSKFIPRSSEDARSKFGLPKNMVVIGGVGRLENVKGFDILIKALGYLPEKVCIAVAGDGTQKRELKQLTIDEGLEDRVYFLGNLSEIETLYPAFDVFALPSRNEGLPLSIIEAQSASIPVVATDVGANCDGLCNETGRLVPPDNPEALADALTECLANPSSISPRQFVEREFSWKTTLNAYEKLSNGVEYGA
ncbi:glycosyltransferase [Flexibacterium corallicola]|uniref:glycosyltransferase n=1 Tax=Flexibacterium corallicola TaxID=3037259 RepID=UPI00286F2E62|nr:glycosyltransferase [Pseudovibrio sp. M1P-2-3]